MQNAAIYLQYAIFELHSPTSFSTQSKNSNLLLENLLKIPSRPRNKPFYILLLAFIQFKGLRCIGCRNFSDIFTGRITQPFSLHRWQQRLSKTEQFDGAIVMAQLAERLLRKQRSLVRIQSSTKFYNKQLLTVEKMNIKKNEAGKDGTFCKFLCCGGIT